MHMVVGVVVEEVVLGRNTVEVVGETGAGGAWYGGGGVSWWY